MAIPSVQVFLGEETVIDGTVTWVDITSYVALEQGITTNRGQSYGAGAQPGTASLTLENTDGRFTIGNTSSPLYPYFHLNSLVKMLRDGRPWFIGRIQSAPLSWPAGGDSDCLVTVTLADRLARFEKMKLDTFPVEEIKALGPIGYWPMSEPSGSTHADNAMANPWPLTYYQPGDGTIAFAGSTGPAGDGQSSPTFTPGTVPPILMADSAAFDSTATSGAFSLSAAFATTAAGLVARLDTRGSLVGDTWYRTADISVVAEGIRVVFNDPAGPWGVYAACSVMDGATHVVTFTIDPSVQVSGQQYFVYLDGVALSLTGSLGGDGRYINLTTTVRVGWGEPVNSGSSFTTAGFAGTISHVAAWTRALSSAEAVEINAALRGVVLGAQAAMLKVLGWRGQSGTALIDAGITDLIPSTSIGSGTLASVLYAISASEAGTLYVDSMDRLTWKNRRTLPSPSITLTQDDIDPGLSYNSDLTRVQTRVTGSRVNGGSVIVEAADYDTIGEISGSVSSLSTDPDDALQHASWVANTGPRNPYIGNLKVDLATATAAVSAATVGNYNDFWWLDDIWRDRWGVPSGSVLVGLVTLTGMPSQTPPDSTVLEVIGEQETISATGWDVTWTVLPAGTKSARDVLTWDDPTLGFWDAGHRWAY